ncbi:hypothetical protein MPSEU_000576100 [Mayamaea pseudoterrestris]|nr:hypothetical protein MPSEU_000576100 [Mayamaea pseudoterrestris]
MMKLNTSSLVLLVTILNTVHALPLQVDVNQRGSECLYEQLNDNESVTLSAFILNGPELRATVAFDGPVAPADITSGAQLKEHLDQFDRGNSVHQKQNDGKLVLFSDAIDFEHLNMGDFELMEDDDDYMEDENSSSDPEATARKRAQQRKRSLEKRQHKDHQLHKQQRKVREEGVAFQKTFKVQAAGWYRFCIKATWYQVTAEIDLRKESEFGGLNEHGHVWTYEEKTMAEEDKLMDEDTASEEGIKDEDFTATKDKLRTLRRLLADISNKQQQERHRLIVHAATNEHSHSRMVLGSLFETVLFMIVTGVQVWTIRRWFKGAPALGR